MNPRSMVIALALVAAGSPKFDHSLPRRGEPVPIVDFPKGKRALRRERGRLRELKRKAVQA